MFTPTLPPIFQVTLFLSLLCTLNHYLLHPTLFLSLIIDHTIFPLSVFIYISILIGLLFMLYLVFASLSLFSHRQATYLPLQQETCPYIPLSWKVLSCGYLATSQVLVSHKKHPVYSAKWLVLGRVPNCRNQHGHWPVFFVKKTIISVSAWKRGCMMMVCAYEHTHVCESLISTLLWLFFT